MSKREIPRIETLAPLVDRVRELAQSEIGSPRQLEVDVFDDGDYRIEVFHLIHEGAHAGDVEGVRYSPKTEEIEYVSGPKSNGTIERFEEKRVLEAYQDPV